VDTLDETTAKAVGLVNSPRSLESCKRQGIDPRELIYMSLGDFKKSLGVEANSLHRD
jgi:hypothetical protein